jgi:Kef-type K+ transport system membrane component KefB
MIFLGGFLAELAGIEAIIGAFLAGLSMNRLIPHVSSLMNRSASWEMPSLSHIPYQCGNAY